ncbi:unnamed protein product [Rotaria sp. Silwood1]|nr:unnamed protein product [Rotaria sp. Silwood1]
MPKGQHDSRETKEFMFNVIKFFEEEKNRAPIPLFNVNDRIMAALQIPHDALGEYAQIKEQVNFLLNCYGTKTETTCYLGPRVAISALINENDFHHPSIDMFKCNQEHLVDSIHFIRWIGETCSKLRKEVCKSLDYLIVHDAFYKENAHSITIIIDNASWHRELTNNAKSPQRS